MNPTNSFVGVSNECMEFRSFLDDNVDVLCCFFQSVERHGCAAGDEDSDLHAECGFEFLQFILDVPLVELLVSNQMWTP